MNITITPGSVNGTVHIPSSKSIGHRAIICAALAKGSSSIHNLYLSKDINATLKAMEKLGAKYQFEKKALYISGAYSPVAAANIDCGESGSTLRFLIPLSLTLSNKAVFNGCGRLGERPLDVYKNMFEPMGIKWLPENGGLPLKIEGSLKSGEYICDGGISSQFITGLILSLPLLKGDSIIKIKGTLESRPYIDLTMDTLRDFGIKIENKDYKEFYIEGNQSYCPRTYTVEGDYSQAAFFLAAGIITNTVTVSGLKKASLQGDSVIVKLLELMGGSLVWDGNKLTAEHSKLNGITIDAAHCPDLVPILSILGAFCEGTTRIINASRLRLKESDRLRSITDGLRRLGANVEEQPDGLIIYGGTPLHGGTVSSYNDHRIAMSLGIAALGCSKPVTITDAQCVDKSYPSFWEDLKSIGGNVYEQHMGK